VRDKSKVKSSQQRAIRQAIQDQYPKLDPFLEQVRICSCFASCLSANIDDLIISWADNSQKGRDSGGEM
jgi:hypothetical protein